MKAGGATAGEERRTETSKGGSGRNLKGVTRAGGNAWVVCCLRPEGEVDFQATERAIVDVGTKAGLYLNRVSSVRGKEGAPPTNLSRGLREGWGHGSHWTNPA